MLGKIPGGGGLFCQALKTAARRRSEGSVRGEKGLGKHKERQRAGEGRGERGERNTRNEKARPCKAALRRLLPTTDWPLHQPSAPRLIVQRL